jgi:hypothetical protein
VLLDSLAINDGRDVLLRQWIDAGVVFKLYCADGRHDLCIPQSVVDLGKLLTHRNGEKGWDGGG